MGSSNWLPPGQVHAGDDGGALQDEEEDGPQRHVLHPLPVHPRDRAKHQLSAGSCKLWVTKKKQKNTWRVEIKLLPLFFTFLNTVNIIYCFAKAIALTEILSRSKHGLLLAVASKNDLSIDVENFQVTLSSGSYLLQ